jgi:hypothetical protein
LRHSEAPKSSALLHYAFIVKYFDLLWLGFVVCPSSSALC